MNTKNSQDFMPLESPTLNNRPNNDERNTRVNVQHNTNNSYYNPSRRKNDNRASTYGMNYNYEALVGVFGGCPWRIPNKHYSKGVLG
jgi:non-canonical poly(A) RNA polymerase PAPD5/7